MYLSKRGIQTAKYFTAMPREYKSNKGLAVWFSLFLKPIDSINSNGIDDLFYHYINKLLVKIWELKF